MKKRIITRVFVAFLAICFLMNLQAQSLPLEMRITDDNHLVTGGNEVEGLYQVDTVHKIEFTFEESNWFSLLDGAGGGPFGTPGVSLVATLTFNDTEVFDSVLINIKGATSDFANNSEKKSFSIQMDEYIKQDLMGYDNLNLNCGYQDHSSMREVLYYDRTRAFAPALKGAFVDLYINGEYWGPYSNVQQIEGTYIKEWFLDNEGTRWRAISPDFGGPGGPGGNPFGTGDATLNYNGADSTDYNEFYTLKKTEKEDPWQDLIDACYELNNLPIEDLYDELKYYIDVDRALWFLAQEIVFVDEDSYVWKGGMDYYAYWDAPTNRIIPLEVDGNSAMLEEFYNWSPFYNENDSDFPLMNRLFANEEIRQRYLAHVRTVLEENFNPDNINPQIDAFHELLDQRVEDDPKKIYSYNQFTNGIEDLKEFVEDRHNYLINHNEVDQTGLTITDLNYISSNGENMPPNANEPVSVTVIIDDSENLGINNVKLYYGTGLQGVFERVEMSDEDGDGVYEGVILGFEGASFVRYYVEAIADNDAQTATFFPKGAEHDVFI